MRNSTHFSLLVPIAADKAEYAGAMPYVFAPGSDGILLCLKSILGLNLDTFEAIYFTILRKHALAYDIDSILGLQLRRLGLWDKARIVILDEPTDTQAETIAETIDKERISGAIFIKDADGYFKAEVFPENGIAVYPLEELNLVDPRNKSYVAVDDMQYVTNIIEKKVIGNLFNAGGYCFADADDFMDVYHRHRDAGHIYLSHLIYSMLLDHHPFRPVKVSDYRDWGTKSLYHLSSNY